MVLSFAFTLGLDINNTPAGSQKWHMND